MTIRLALAAVLALAPLACKKEGAPAAPASGGAPPAATKAAPAAGAPVVARWGQREITLAALDETVAQELYELRQNALEKMIVKDLVKAAAQREGKDEQTLVREVVEKRKKAVTDEELKKTYEEVKDRLQGTSFEDAKQFLKMQAERGKQQEAVAAYVEELKKQAGVKVFLDPPRTKVEAKGPSKGPANAPITIVEFSDFECPYCSRGRTVAEQVLKEYPGKVRLVFRDYPLDFHQKAQKAAEAAHCADEQGKFWELHDKMFDAQDKLDVPDLKAAAKALGLDAVRFDACLDSGKMAERVKENLKAGQEAGVTGTPAFFVNGRLLSGALPLAKFKEVIDAELKR